MTHGPNVSALAIERCAQIMVERSGHAGGEFGKAVAVAARMGTSISADMRESIEWVHAAINAVRAAPDCVWSGDEEIAGEILQRIKDRRKA